VTGEIQLLQADARSLPIPDESVQCIVTSPPYWGLRKYSGEQESVWGGHPKIDFASLQPIPCPHQWESTTLPGISGGQNQGDKSDNPNGATNRPVPAHVSGSCVRCGAWRGAFGLEPTIEMYIEHTVTILRELRRVLRPDGVLFWNIGDSYAGGGNYRGMTSENTLSDKQASNRGARGVNQELGASREKLTGSLKPKDLCLIPARVAIAAQSDGWWVRSMIVWAKPNPMPESFTDRPTDAYEYIIMLTKSERYFWDADAVSQPATHAGKFVQTNGNEGMDGGYDGHRTRDGFRRGVTVAQKRNLRNVWNFPTQPYAGAHFATFPEELPRRCILTATSARGACLQCGAPWERVVRASGGTIGESWHDHSDDIGRGHRDETGGKSTDGTYRRDSIGWKPTCLCPGQRGKVGPCVVLDPFAGSGTTGRVALELRRRAILCDLAYGENDDYRKLALERTRNVQVEFF
jgi:DNA modification methylase